MDRGPLPVPKGSGNMYVKQWSAVCLRQCVACFSGSLRGGRGLCCPRLCFTRVPGVKCCLRQFLAGAVCVTSCVSVLYVSLGRAQLRHWLSLQRGKQQLLPPGQRSWVPRALGWAPSTRQKGPGLQVATALFTSLKHPS